MSASSPREAAATEQARTQSQLAQELQGIAGPQLREMLSTISKELGAGGEPELVRNTFADARSTMETGYAQAFQGGRAGLEQQALQMGTPDAWRATTGGLADLGTYLERDRARASRELDTREALSGLQTYNYLMSQLGQGVGAGLNLANGAYGAQAGAISGMSSVSPLGATLGGAASGAATGFSVGGWPGAIIGGVGGGALGYFGST